MKRAITFEGDTWERSEDLRHREPALFKNVCRILREMQRENPATGTGKPAPLKHSLQSLWSRRLSLSDRLIYRFDDTHIYIMAIGGHYDQQPRRRH
jgi:toxin YoeB